MVRWWVEWYKIFVFIIYVERFDSFTTSTSTWCIWWDLMRHHQYSLESRIDLKAFLDSVFYAKSEKIISIRKKKNKIENFAHFAKGSVFLEQRHLSSISYFSTGNKILLGLTSRYLWSAAKNLSNDVKKAKEFAWSLNCLHHILSNFIFLEVGNIEISLMIHGQSTTFDVANDHFNSATPWHRYHRTTRSFHRPAVTKLFIF